MYITIRNFDGRESDGIIYQQSFSYCLKRLKYYCVVPNK